MIASCSRGSRTLSRRLQESAVLRGLAPACILDPHCARRQDARETLACLRVAEAFGYVEAMPPAVLDRMSRVVGTLVRVAA